MKRSKIDRRIRAEVAREGSLGLYLVREFKRRRAQLKRDVDLSFHRA